MLANKIIMQNYIIDLKSIIIDWIKQLSFFKGKRKTGTRREKEKRRRRKRKKGQA